MRVPIFTDEAEQSGGWHGDVLAKAFRARGVEPVFVSLQDCQIHISDSGAKVVIPYFTQNPIGAFVRGIAAGTLQQVITRLNILHILAMQEVKIYNSGKAIERTVDKGMTSFLLRQHGIATPETWVCESRHHAHDIIRAYTPEKKLILKPLFGSQGVGIRVLEQSSAMPLPMDHRIDGVFYLQQFIDTAIENHDFRVLVVNNQAVAAMRRSGNGWLNNVAQGASCKQIDDADILELAEQAAKAVDIDYCGVDIIRDKQGALSVLEVNSIPAWRGLQGVTKINVAQILADDFLSRF